MRIIMMIMVIFLLEFSAENAVPDGDFKCHRCISLSDYYCTDLNPQILNHLQECPTQLLSKPECVKVIIQVAIQKFPVVWRECVIKEKLDFCQNPVFPPEIRALVTHVYSCDLCTTDGCNNANNNRNMQPILFTIFILVVFFAKVY